MKVWKFLLTCVSKLAFYFKTITLFTGTTTQWLGKRRQKNVKILSKRKLKALKNPYVYFKFIFVGRRWEIFDDTSQNDIAQSCIQSSFVITLSTLLASIQFDPTMRWLVSWHSIDFWLATMQMEYFNGWLLWLVRIQEWSVSCLYSSPVNMDLD